MSVLVFSILTMDILCSLFNGCIAIYSFKTRLNVGLKISFHLLYPIQKIKILLSMLCGMPLTILCIILSMTFIIIAKYFDKNVTDEMKNNIDFSNTYLDLIYLFIEL